MKRVTGIGGIFFNARDPVALRAWYKAHLAVDVQDWGGAAFRWTDEAGKPTAGTTICIGDAAGVSSPRQAQQGRALAASRGAMSLGLHRVSRRKINREPQCLN